MSFDFIDQLPVGDETKHKLESLGVETPESLLAMIEAAPEEFQEFAGAAETELIRSELRKRIPQQRLELIQSPPPEYGLGARLHRAPRLPAAPFDIKRRDRLFAELQELRSDPARRDSAKVHELERELNALLEGGRI